jgi:hypothetical protein
MASTMIYERKRKREKEKKRELEQVRERALKFYKGHGLADVVGLNVTPVAELNALEAYLEELEYLRHQLQAKYGTLPEFQREAWWLDREISTCIKRIVKLNIQIVSEGRGA